MSVLSRVVDWLRAGYPAGVPEQDYVPVLALLGRRLTDDEVQDLTQELVAQGLVPVDRTDIGVGITRVTQEMPTEQDIQRVRQHLERSGYPMLDEEFHRLMEDSVEVGGGLTITRVRPKVWLDESQVLSLYASVGWSSYTAAPERLLHALRKSHRVIAAWDADRQLVGLARAISDRETIAYIQDVLVKPELQHIGVGRALLDRLLREYEQVRQVVLVTDTEPRQRAFYEAMGFTEAHENQPSLRCYVKLRG